jgi:hypothetical protein
MERVKSLNNLTEEELLKEASKVTDEIKNPIYEGTSEVIHFLVTYNIRAGAIKVPKPLLYGLYKAWSASPMKRTSFLKQATNILGGDERHRCYELNIDGLKIKLDTIKALNSRQIDKTKIPLYKKHFETFLNKFEISEGMVWVKGEDLYLLYDKWTYQNKKTNPLGYLQFISMCDLYFKRKRITSSKIRWYGLNLTIKQHIRTYYDQNQQKKQGEIPGIEKRFKLKN